MARADYHAWYGKQSWRNRARQQLMARPLCEMCERGGRIVPAVCADHITPHRGDPKLWLGPLQSLCKKCHASHKQSDEVIGYSKEIGEDGLAYRP
jgi:5-methylcytosine-specific restriction protein A